jgi:hypothetical protein
MMPTFQSPSLKCRTAGFPHPRAHRGKGGASRPGYGPLRPGQREVGVPRPFVRRLIRSARSR